MKKLYYIYILHTNAFFQLYYAILENYFLYKCTYIILKLRTILLEQGFYKIFFCTNN